MMTVEEFFTIAQSQHKKCYFWTFTWPTPMSYWCYSKSWDRFVDLLNRNYTSEEFMAVRVWERHPEHGGLHIHMLCNERLYVGLMRRLARHCGLGFVLHVAPVRDGYVVPGGLKVGPSVSVARYMSKYMTKDGAIDGLRLWGKLGQWEHVKCSDLEFRSKEADAFRSANAFFRDRGMNAREAYNHTRVFLSRDNSALLS